MWGKWVQRCAMFPAGCYLCLAIRAMWNKILGINPTMKNVEYILLSDLTHDLEKMV